MDGREVIEVPLSIVAAIHHDVACHISCQLDAGFRGTFPRSLYTLTRPMAISKATLFWVLSSLVSTAFAQADSEYTSYPNAFVDPNYILTGKYDSVTQASQQSLVGWADQLNAQGPWCKVPFIPTVFKMG